jgi:hypothetical protein
MRRGPRSRADILTTWNRTEDITHGRSGIPWTEKWPSIGIIAVVLQAGHWGGNSRAVARNQLFHFSLRSRCDAGRIANLDPGPTLGESDGQRQILEILSGDVAVGRPILTAPGVPADRVRALRKAFDETLVDPQFIEAAKQANIYVNPMGGEELQAMMEKIAGPSEKMLTMLRQATEFKGAVKTGP